MQVPNPDCSSFPIIGLVMFYRLALLLVALLQSLAFAQNASAPPASASPAPVPRPPIRRNQTRGDQSPTFSVNVKLVSVFASVADGNGAPYANLQKQDFRIFEDGIEQKLAVFERESGLPLSIVMALDTSLSTRKDLPLEVASARKFAHTMLRPVDAISLYEFSTYVSLALPFTNMRR